MANQQIQQYASAASTDAVNDYFLGYNNTATAYRKYNRNILLGITGSPVGTTDSQTLANKILTSPTINGATLSGTLSGTYTIGGTPTFPSSVVSLTSTQTLTNKTLTAPVISGGTIDNSTITVDSISGHTTSTIVTVGGVQMNNGVIGTSGAVTSTSIAIGAVQPQSLTSGAGTGWTWQTFTPSFSSLTVGNGTLTARYTQIGKLVWVFMVFTLGTTSAVGTDPRFVPPIAASTLYATVAQNTIVGFGQLFAGAVGAIAEPFFNAANDTIHIGYAAPSATNNALTGSSATTPGTWTSGNNFNITCFYEAA